jgi:hypothetical protein
MKTAIKRTFAASLLGMASLFMAPTALAGAELRASATEVAVGDTVKIEAASGSSLLPVYAREWATTPELDIVSSSRTGATVKAISVGLGNVSASVNLKDLAVAIRVVPAHPVVAPPEEAPPAAAAPVVDSPVAAPP